MESRKRDGERAILRERKREKERDREKEAEIGKRMR